MLNGRRLVLHEREDLDMWLEFASICRNTGNVKLSERILNISMKMLSTGDSSVHSPNSRLFQEIMERKLKYAMLKQQWTIGERPKALQGLDNLIRMMSNNGNMSPIAGPIDPLYREDASVQLNCILKLGQWKLAMIEPGVPVDANTRKEVLKLYHRATIVDPTNYIAWHEVSFPYPFSVSSLLERMYRNE